MKFEAVKCDECGRIQGESNHWQKIRVWDVGIDVAAVALGPRAEMLKGNGLAVVTELDLCGQGCAVKHIAKLLGWNVPTETA